MSVPRAGCLALCAQALVANEIARWRKVALEASIQPE